LKRNCRIVKGEKNCKKKEPLEMWLRGKFTTPSLKKRLKKKLGAEGKVQEEKNGLKDAGKKEIISGEQL